MITDRQAKALVESLREISRRNASERGEQASEYWQGQSDGRASAYSFAADWLEKLIASDEEGAK